MQSSRFVSFSVVAVASWLASAPVGAAVILEEAAEATASASYGSPLDLATFAVGIDADDTTPTASASSTLPSPGGDASTATAEATVDGPLRTYASTGGAAEEPLPLSASSIASWAAIYRAETAPGETSVDVDLGLHVSGTLTLSDGGAALSGLLSAGFGATLVAVGDLPGGVFDSTTPFGLFDGSASLGIDLGGARELARFGSFADSLFDLAFVEGAGCGGSGSCVVTVTADLLLDDALTLADGDEFGVLLLLSSTSQAPGDGALFSESDFSHTASLAVSSGRGTVARVLATIVPEPASFLLLVSGLLAFAYARSRPVTVRSRQPSR